MKKILIFSVILSAVTSHIFCSEEQRIAVADQEMQPLVIAVQDSEQINQGDQSQVLSQSIEQQVQDINNAYAEAEMVFIYPVVLFAFVISIFDLYSDASVAIKINSIMSKALVVLTMIYPNNMQHRRRYEGLLRLAIAILLAHEPLLFKAVIESNSE